MEIETKVIYADFNDFDEDGNLHLTCTGSQESLAKVMPREGEEVMLSDGELYVKATIRRNANGYYEAIGSWEFEKDVPKNVPKR